MNNLTNYIREYNYERTLGTPPLLALINGPLFLLTGKTLKINNPYYRIPFIGKYIEKLDLVIRTLPRQRKLVLEENENLNAKLKEYLHYKELYEMSSRNNAACNQLIGVLNSTSIDLKRKNDAATYFIETLNSPWLAWPSKKVEGAFETRRLDELEWLIKQTAEQMK